MGITQEGEGMNAGAGLPWLICTKNESVPIRQFLSVEFVQAGAISPVLSNGGG